TSATAVRVLNIIYSMGQWIYARSAPARSNLLMHPHSNCRTCFSGCRSLYKVGVNRYYCGQSTPTLQGAIMFDLSPRIQDLKQKLEAFMDEHIYPNEELFYQQVKQNKWGHPAILEELKQKARNQGLWNLFLPESERGAGLTNEEYAHLCEIMGRVSFAPEVFNCNAPDTGNMETIERYGNEEQKEKWLKPLLAGEIRSCFSMTEPDVASSDATNIQCEIRREGDEYVINGTKWWSSGAM